MRWVLVRGRGWLGEEGGGVLDRCLVMEQVRESRMSSALHLGFTSPRYSACADPGAYRAGHTDVHMCAHIDIDTDTDTQTDRHID